MMKLWIFVVTILVDTIANAKEEAPPLPGILPGSKGPKVILAGDVDFPPFSYLGSAADDFPMTGFAVDFLYALETVCDIEPYVVQTDVSE